MGNEETLRGARGRVQHCRELAPDADFFVGLEGGCERVDEANGSRPGRHELSCYAWIVVEDRAGRQGRGKTGVFFLPPRVAELVAAGKELGDANDEVFGRHDSKRGLGAVGILTDGHITRQTYYEQVGWGRRGGGHPSSAPPAHSGVLCFCVHGAHPQAVALALIPFRMPDIYT